MRNKLGLICIGSILFVCLAVWLCGAMIDDFYFGFAHFIVLLFGALAIFVVVYNILNKNIYGINIFAVIFSAVALFTATAKSIGFEFLYALILWLMFSAACFVLTVAIKKPWDKGDNQQEGYKKYSERNKDE